MLPVRDVRLDEPGVVLEDRFQRLGFVGRCLGKLLANVAGFEPGQDIARFQVAKVVRHAIGDLFGGGAELLGLHVAGRSLGRCDLSCHPAQGTRVTIASTRRG